MYLAMYHKGVAVTSPIFVFIISVAKAIKQNNDGIRLSRQVPIHLRTVSDVPLLSAVRSTHMITDKIQIVACLIRFAIIIPHFFLLVPAYKLYERRAEK